MVVGDGSTAVFQITWRRLSDRRFAPAAWVRARARRSGRGRTVDAEAPHAGALDAAAWARDESGARPTTWWAAAPDGAVVEMIVNVGLKPDTADLVCGSVIPSFRFRAAHEATRIAVFGALFDVPGAFRQTASELRLGDIAVKLERPRQGDILCVRQVYPAELALSRRPLARWLELWPFRGHRRFEVQEPPTPCDVRRNGRTVPALMLAGRKRLPWPLGRLAPLETFALACHDEQAARVLLALHDAPDDADRDMLEKCIAKMAAPDDLQDDETDADE
jgi:hypothetical protein